MKVSIKAQIFLTSKLQADNKRYCLLSVLAGGCNGMQYSIIFVNELPKYETIEIGTNIYVDSLSLTYLEGCTLALDEKLGFKRIVVNNPAAKSSCSCGSSFSV